MNIRRVDEKYARAFSFSRISFFINWIFDISRMRGRSVLIAVSRSAITPERFLKLISLPRIDHPVPPYISLREYAWFMRRNRPVNHRSALLLVINSHLSTLPFLLHRRPFLFPSRANRSKFRGESLNHPWPGAVDRRIFLLALSLFIPNATIGTRDCKKKTKKRRVKDDELIDTGTSKVSARVKTMREVD